VRRFPGPRSLRNHPVDNLEFALLADGAAMDKLYPIDMDRAFRKLDEIRQHVAV
jgi:putative spermidine/putrescine transport system substrate-binding protein